MWNNCPQPSAALLCETFLDPLKIMKVSSHVPCPMFAVFSLYNIVKSVPDP